MLLIYAAHSHRRKRFIQSLLRGHSVVAVRDVHHVYLAGVAQIFVYRAAHEVELVVLMRHDQQHALSRKKIVKKIDMSPKTR